MVKSCLFRREAAVVALNLPMGAELSLKGRSVLLTLLIFTARSYIRPGLWITADLRWGLISPFSHVK